MLIDEPVRIYVPLLMHLWIMQACHSTAFCHLGTTRTLHMLERFYWWIDVNVCTRWWLRHCLTCQARNKTRPTVRWLIISMPLPDDPGIVITVTTSALFGSRREATRTSCSWPTVSVVGPICSPSLPLSSPLRARPTFESTTTFPYGSAHAAYSRTTASISAPSFHKLSTSDHLAYWDLATDRQQRANDIDRRHHALTVPRVNRRNSALADALRPVPKFVVGGWAWVYNSASTIPVSYTHLTLPTILLV